MHVRVCPQCGEEYRPEIVACVDCGVDLVDADDEALVAAPGREANPAGGHLDQGGHQDEERQRILYRSANARELTPLADELAGAGFPVRILPWVEERRSTYYCLVVPEAAADAALSILAPVVERNPDLRYHAVTAPLEDAEVEATDSSCPACEAHVPARALECPACGLSFYRDEEEGS